MLKRNNKFIYKILNIIKPKDEERQKCDYFSKEKESSTSQAIIGFKIQIEDWI